ncbi:hypothetical protein LGK95_20095 [Clostridium algoriphilum]|uniref:hypothetical protein n=1 Tax=Clostridium algoriphilum TaxID=198347 RepID=UPI001CF1E954|nr:hypothetical protein [Clostridium algoriphilum]MCB2295780.1 hypothetical protein [Clostridium algoriphilum]
MRKTKSALIFIIVITILSIVVFVGCSSMKSSNKLITINVLRYNVIQINKSQKLQFNILDS